MGKAAILNLSKPYLCAEDFDDLSAEIINLKSGSFILDTIHAKNFSLNIFHRLGLFDITFHIEKLDGPSVITIPFDTNSEVHCEFWFNGNLVGPADHYLFTGKNEDIVSLTMKYS